MNKKLISLAVAAALAAPAAAMAEATIYGTIAGQVTYEDVDNVIAPTFETMSPAELGDPQTATANPDGSVTYTGVYGPDDTPWSFVSSAAQLEQIQNGSDNIRIIMLDENGRPVVATRGQDFKGWGVNQSGYLEGENPANRFGLKGSEDLGNGLKAIYQIELGFNFGDDNIPGGSNGGISVRNSFVGLAGGFGTALVGRHDTPMKISTGKLDLFSDTIGDYNGTVGFTDYRLDNTIAYISPSFSGFSFMGAMVAPGGGTAGSGLNINSDSLAGAYSLAAIYNNGPFYASAAYEVLSNEMFMDTATSEAGRTPCFANNLPLLNCNYVSDDFSKWRLGLGLLDWNGFTLTGVYEQQDDLPGGQQSIGIATVGPDGVVDVYGQRGVKEQRLWQVQAGYAFGNNQIKAMYGAVDRDADKPFDNTRRTVAINSIRDDLEGDRETWAIGFDHNFSKRTQAYALYTEVTDDQDGLPGVGGAQWSGFSIGMVHKF